RYPGDFWVNHDLAVELYDRVKPSTLGQAYTAGEYQLLEEAIGFHRAALALRPANPGGHVDLGIALLARGDTAGARAAFSPGPPATAATPCLPGRSRPWRAPSPPTAGPSPSPPNSPGPTTSSASPCRTRGTRPAPSPPSARPFRPTPGTPRPA